MKLSVVSFHWCKSTPIDGIRPIMIILSTLRASGSLGELAQNKNATVSIEIPHLNIFQNHFTVNFQKLLNYSLVEWDINFQIVHFSNARFGNVFIFVKRYLCCYDEYIYWYIEICEDYFWKAFWDVFNTLLFCCFKMSIC